MDDGTAPDHDPADLTLDELRVARILCDVATHHDPGVVGRVRRLVAGLDDAAPDWRHLSDAALAEAIARASAAGGAADAAG